MWKVKKFTTPKRGHRGHDYMVIGFTTTYVISAYHHNSCEFDCTHGEVYSIQHHVIKFVSDLQMVGGFLQALQFPPPIKLTTTDITEILLTLSLNTINQPNNKTNFFRWLMWSCLLLTKLTVLTTLLDEWQSFLYTL